jgi:hypothetical protein
MQQTVHGDTVDVNWTTSPTEFNDLFIYLLIYFASFLSFRSFSLSSSLPVKM